MIRSPICLVFLWLASLTVRAEVINIDNAELAQLTARGIPLIDIRTPGEWRNTGVIPGSRLLTFFDEAGRANAPQWLERARSVARPDRPVIVICRSGNRTQAVARFLSEQAGYATVYNVTHGIAAWSREGRPMVPSSPAQTVCAPNTSC